MGQLEVAAGPPPAPDTGMAGPRFQAIVAYLTGQAHLSKRQIEEVLEDLLGVALSLGTITAIEKNVSEALAAPVEEAHQYVQEQPVVHSDETGWRENRKRAWLWAAVTPWVTLFLVHVSRGAVAARALLGGFSGYLITDRWNAYNGWAVRRRQLCWAHLIRDFRGFTERGPNAAQIGEALLVQTEKMFALWHRVRDGTLKRSSLRAYMSPIRRKVENLLDRGTRCGESKTEGMCEQMLKLAPALWTFVRIMGVEPTNNAAERAVRPAVLYRKGCFGTHSADGSRFVERLLTVVMTLRQQKRNVFDYLTRACTAALHRRKAPSLLPPLRHQAALAA
jgi:transposase